MTVEVLIFGSAALAVKADRVIVTVGHAATVGEVAAALIEQHPSLRFALSAPRLAVNQAFAAPDTKIRSGDEVALVTLLGGG